MIWFCEMCSPCIRKKKSYKTAKTKAKNLTTGSGKHSFPQRVITSYHMNNSLFCLQALEYLKCTTCDWGKQPWVEVDIHPLAVQDILEEQFAMSLYQAYSRCGSEHSSLKYFISRYCNSRKGSYCCPAWAGWAIHWVREIWMGRELQKGDQEKREKHLSWFENWRKKRLRAKSWDLRGSCSISEQALTLHWTCRCSTLR